MAADRSPSSSGAVCPICNQADRVYKVSRVYVEGTAYLKSLPAVNSPDFDLLLMDMLPAGSESEKHALADRLVKDLAPPSGRTQVTRRIHPDWMIVFLCAIGLIIAYQVSGTQPESLPIVVALIAATLLFYLLARRPVLERFLSQNRLDADEKHRVERDVGLWMQLYLCTREPCVFDSERNRSAPVDQMRRLFGE